MTRHIDLTTPSFASPLEAGVSVSLSATLIFTGIVSSRRPVRASFYISGF